MVITFGCSKRDGECDAGHTGRKREVEGGDNQDAKTLDRSNLASARDHFETCTIRPAALEMPLFDHAWVVRCG